MFRFLYALTGFALAGAIAMGWYFSVPHYDRPISGESRLYLQEKYPGGTFKNIWEYHLCEERWYPDGRSEHFWVIFKAGGDREVTGKYCWKVQKSTNGD